MKSSNVIPGKVLSTLLLILTSFSCRSSPTGPHVAHNVQLSADYVACTEVWLKISFGDTLGGSFAINRDGNTVLSGHFSGADTTVIDTTALPERTYNYVCWRMVNGLPRDSSSNLQVQTTDTTSNNFTWQTFTFGEPGSTLYDVAVISDTDIVCAGAIYLKDSTGQLDPQPYNLATWNRQNWKLRKVPYYYQGQASYDAIYALWPFDSNDIWYSNSVHWNGKQFSNVDLAISVFTGHRINKMWGSSTGELYIVGDNGTIAYSSNHGSSWQGLNSGTTSNFQNIWGSRGKVIAVTFESKILTIPGTTLQDTLNWTGSRLRGIWFGDNTPIYVSGVGVWKNELGVWREMEGLPYYYYTGIRGNEVNDLFAIGWSGMVAHYNGSTWHVYSELANPAWDFQSLAVNGNVAAMVGFEAEGAVVGKALAVIGRRS